MKTLTTIIISLFLMAPSHGQDSDLRYFKLDYEADGMTYSGLQIDEGVNSIYIAEVYSTAVPEESLIVIQEVKISGEGNRYDLICSNPRLLMEGELMSIEEDYHPDHFVMKTVGDHWKTYLLNGNKEIEISLSEVDNIETYADILNFDEIAAYYPRFLPDYVSASSKPIYSEEKNPWQPETTTSTRSNQAPQNQSYQLNPYRGTGNITGKWMTVNAEGVYNYMEIFPTYFNQINPQTGYKSTGQLRGFFPNSTYCGGQMGQLNVNFQLVMDKRTKSKNVLKYQISQNYQFTYSSLYVRLPDGFVYNGLQSLKNLVPARKESDCSGNYHILDSRAVGAVSTSNTSIEGNYEVTRSQNSSFYDHSKSKGSALVTQSNGLYAASQRNGILAENKYGNLILDKIIIPPTVGGDKENYIVIHLNYGSCQNAEILFSNRIGLTGGILSK